MSSWAFPRLARPSHYPVSRSCIFVATGLSSGALRLTCRACSSRSVPCRRQPDFAPDACRAPGPALRQRPDGNWSVDDVFAVLSHGGLKRVDGRLGVESGSCEGGTDHGAECAEAGLVFPDVDDGKAAVGPVADVVEAALRGGL